MATRKSFPKPNTSAVWLILIAIGILILAWFVFRWFLAKNQMDRMFKIPAGFLLLLVSAMITVILFLIVTSIFGVTNFKKGFLNFLIGDNGTYSLSRLQAVVWAVVIIAYQFQLLICLCVNPRGTFLSIYQPVFSESAMWLLGLSLTSYVAVKGITVNGLVNNPAAITNVKITPKFSDILVGANGLDFSKCQMLVWTIVAIGVFEIKCYYFNIHMLYENRDVVIKLMNHFYDEYSVKDKLTDIYPWVPFLPWSFVVLMGLSQGVYVGKKLVPTFKLNDMKVGKQQELSDLLTQLQAKKQFLYNILTKSTIDPNSAVDKINLALYKKDIDDTTSMISDLKGQIRQITATQNLLPTS